MKTLQKNGRRPKKMKDDLEEKNGRQPQKKMEDDLNINLNKNKKWTKN
jgi:hypothetical protein